MARNQKLEVLFYPMLQDFQKSTVFGRFSGSGPLSFWQYKQREDEDECGAMMV
jgi:hypothetical protein